MMVLREERELFNDTMFKALVNNFSISLPQSHSKGDATGLVSISPKKFMVCAAPNSGEYREFWGVFLHESCHLDQFVEGSSIFDGMEEEPLWDWYQKGKIEKGPRLKGHMMKLLQVEVDCELRAIEKIDSYKLNLDRDYYIRNACLYLYMFRAFYEFNCSMSTEICDELIYEMPNEILDWRQYWNIGKNKVYKEHKKLLTE